jgi:hypothetical protein
MNFTALLMQGCFLAICAFNAARIKSVDKLNSTAKLRIQQHQTFAITAIPLCYFFKGGCLWNETKHSKSIGQFDRETYLAFGIGIADHHLTVLV